MTERKGTADLTPSDLGQADLSQADLSDRSLREMSAAERAELRRRFERFVSAVSGRANDPAPQKPRAVRKWVPGAPHTK